MSARPWMPLYIADYLAKTQALTAQESGAYLHLIMHYWQHGPLPDDDAFLCRISRVHPPHWPRVRRTLEPFYDLTKRPGSWSHDRIDQEITKAEEISQKRANAAMQMHSKSNANAEQMHTHLQSHIKSTFWLSEKDERWDFIAEQMLKDTGKRLTPRGSRHQDGIGAYVPERYAAKYTNGRNR